ncbi:MAG: ATP-binding cassette domain-containing protein [Candidatus Schekmanbacteria bacterium]|nr:MAG: ATP-binding cassette domain-containing protein [Candidatus Schekmanbacteria bacterium]
MIEIDSISKYYGDVCAVDNVSFKIKKGEILGLLGPNGAGKTTTLRILTCFMKPTSGNIKVKDYNIYDNVLEIKKLIGYLPEAAPIYPDMLVYDYLSFVAAVREIDPKERDNRIKKLSRLCAISDVMHKSINELSKGYKQRVGLAHAMMNNPEILVLDEPTSGLDPNQIIEIREIIKEIGKEKTVILSTHILSEAEATCDRIVIINKGKIVADGSTNEIKQKSGNESMLNITLQNCNFEEAEKAFVSLAGVEKVLLKNEDNGTVDLQLNIKKDTDIRADVYNIIKERNWILLEFYRETRTLETIFRELTVEK